jgi:hypothetical protein
MLSYDKWKLLNETLGGSTVLGLGRNNSLGLISNIPTLQEKSCGANECGEGMDGEDDDEEFEDSAVDIEDYTDGDADEEESEEETDEYEDGVDSEEETEEDEYEDDTDDEDDEDDEDSDEEEETDYVADEDEEYEDGEDEDEVEDVEVETDDADPDSAMKQLMAMAMKPEAKKHHGKKMRETGKSMKLMGVDNAGKTKMKPDGSKLVPPNDGDKPVKESEEDAWWKSVTNQIGIMDNSGNIKIQEAEEVEVEIDSKPSLEDLKGLALPAELKNAVKQYIRGVRGKGGATASVGPLKNLLRFMIDLALEPILARKSSSGLGQGNIIRLLRSEVEKAFDEHEAKEAM